MNHSIYSHKQVGKHIDFQVKHMMPGSGKHNGGKLHNVMNAILNMKEVLSLTAGLN